MARFDPKRRARMRAEFEDAIAVGNIRNLSIDELAADELGALAERRYVTSRELFGAAQSARLAARWRLGGLISGWPPA